MRAIALSLLAALVPAAVWAQKLTLGPTVTGVVASGEGVGRTCTQSNYPFGMGLALTVPVFSRLTTVQFSGRGYWLSQGSDCVTLAIPVSDGTYLEEDRINLLSRSFVTTDVRLAVRLGEQIPMSLALGGGGAWHEGHDLPYVVLGTAFTAVDQPYFRVQLGAEYQWLRVTSDQFLRTVANGELVSEEALGQVHHWSHAVVIGVSLGFLL
jgi:hypothetical protein